MLKNVVGVCFSKISKSLHEAFNAIFEGQTQVLYMPLAIGVGIWICYTYGIVPLAYVIVLGVFGWWILPSTTVVKRLIAGCVLLIALGGVAAILRILYLPVSPFWYKGIYSVSGTVIHSDYSPSRTKVVLDSVEIRSRAIAGKVQLSLPNFVTEGSRITVKSFLRSPPKPVMPRAFDLRFVAYFRGIQAYGKAISPAHIIIAGRPSLRGRITQGIFEALPPTVAGVAAAFVTGDRVGISPQDVKALRGSGLAHLLAISGLHISLVMASVYMLVTLVTIVFLRNYSTRIPLKIIASIAALSVGFVYLFIANFSLPTLRAFLMASILVVGVLTDRRVVTLRSVALSASLILLIMPESLFSISFQLSFAAVSVLVFLYYHSRFQGTGVIATVKNLSITSLAVFLATIPFTAHYFGTIAVYSVVANIIAIPLMTFLVMPLLFCGVIVYLLVHSTMVLSLSGVALSLLLSLAHFVYALPHSVITVSRLPVASLLFFILSGYLWLTSGQSGRLIISALLSIAMIIAILPKDIAAAYVDNAGVVAIKYNDSYLINARRNSYFAKWVHLETGLAVKRAKICKKRVCYVDAIAYVYGTKMPAYLCDKHWKDRQGKNKRVKLIVAPRASIKNCGVPSIDALDIYLNGSYIIKTATRVTHASSGTGSFLGIFPSMARWWYHARTPHRL